MTNNNKLTLKTLHYNDYTFSPPKGQVASSTLAGRAILLPFSDAKHYLVTHFYPILATHSDKF